MGHIWELVKWLLCPSNILPHFPFLSSWLGSVVVSRWCFRFPRLSPGLPISLGLTHSLYWRIVLERRSGTRCALLRDVIVPHLCNQQNKQMPHPHFLPHRSLGPTWKTVHSGSDSAHTTAHFWPSSSPHWTTLADCEKCSSCCPQYKFFSKNF